MTRRDLLTATIMAGALPASASAGQRKASSGVQNEWLRLKASNDEWTATSVTAVAGDLVAVRVEGTIKVGAFLGKAGPEGSPGDGIGGVMLKIGDGGQNKVGHERFFFSPHGGPIKLRVHDTNHADNSGEYIVQVIRVPSAMIPALSNPPPELGGE